MGFSGFPNRFFGFLGFEVFALSPNGFSCIFGFLGCVWVFGLCLGFWVFWVYGPIGFCEMGFVGFLGCREMGFRLFGF